MKISVITPVYNDPRVQRCIQSVDSQKTDADIEHIVVDSNSTDDTVNVLEAHADQIDVLIREDDDGMYDAINNGIEEATGDIIGILNADDRYEDKQVLEDVASAMEDPVIDGIFGDLVYVDDADEVVRYWKSGEYRQYKFYLGWMPAHPTFYVRRDLYEELGGYDTSFPISSDYELMLRFLLNHNVRTAYIDRVMVRMTLGGMSNSSIGNMVQVIQDMYGSWDKHGRFGKFVAPFLHPIDKLPQLLRKPP